MNFYDKMPNMECLSGDTLPAFRVGVTGSALTGATMQIILAREQTPDVTAVVKECTPENGGFAVQLTSDDTADLTEGTYIIHFRLIVNDLSFRKLAGQLYVHQVAAGGDTDE